MKKIAQILIVIMIFSSVFVVPSFAGTVVKLTDDRVNVRTGPGTTYAILGSASTGNTFPYLATAKDSNGVNWYKIQYTSTRVGYIISTYSRTETTTTTVTPPTTGGFAGKLVTTATPSLNVRSSATTSSTILGRLPNGSVVDYYSLSGGWYKISYGGKVAYISAAYAKVTSGTPTAPAPTPTPTTPTTQTYVGTVVTNATPSLNVRSAATTSSTILGRVPSGTVLKYYSLSGGWYKVEYNGRVAYISAAYAKVASGTPTTPTPTPTPTPTAPTFAGTVVTNATPSLNVRAAASTTSSILGRVPSGTKLKYYSLSGGWYKVDYNGRVAYISAAYAKVTSTTPITTPKPTVPVIPTTPTVPTTIGKLVVTASPSLNVRSAASTSSTILGKLVNGATVNYYSLSAGWYKIDYNGRVAYISADFARVSSTTPPAPITELVAVGTLTTTATPTLNVRSQPNTTSTILGRVGPGTRFSYYSLENNWYKINYNGRVAYVSADFIKLDPISIFNPTLTEPLVVDPNNYVPATDEVINDYVEIHADNVNVRTAPWGDVIGRLQTGQVVSVVNAAFDKDNKVWYEIRFEGTKAWIHSDYARALYEQVRGQLVVTRDSVQILSVPGTTNAKIVGIANTNQLLNYYKGVGDFYQIEYFGQFAFVHRDYVRDMTKPALSAKDVRISISPSEFFKVGEPVIAKAEATGFTRPEYRFWVSTGGMKQLLQAYSPLSTTTFTPTTLKNSSIIVEVREKGAFTRYDVWSQARVTLEAQDVRVALTLDGDAVYLNEPAKFKALTTGFRSPQFSFFESIGGVYTKLRDYSTDPTFTLNPTELKTRTLVVQVKETGSTNPYDEFNMMQFDTIAPAVNTLQLNADRSEVFLDTPVNFTAKAEGSSKIEYRFLLQSAQGSTVLKEFSADPTLNWTPGANGTYTITAEARLIGSSVAAKTVSKSFTVADRTMKDLNIRLNQSAFYTNTPVEISFESTGTDQAVYYAEVADAAGNKTKLQDASASSMVTWTPKQTGTYTIYLYGKDRSAAAFQLSRYLQVTVKAPQVTEVRLKTDFNGYVYGKTPIDLTAWSTGSGKPLYKFAYHNGVAWITIQDYSPSPEAVFLPPAFGKYTLGVFAKDHASAANQQTATITFEVKDFTQTVNYSFIPTQNQTVNRYGWVPDVIVNHSTGGIMSSAINWFLNPTSDASSHFIIGRDGRVVQMVPIQYMSWTNGLADDLYNTTRENYLNAPASIVRTRAANPNRYTVSIENEGGGLTQGVLTDLQLKANIETSKFIAAEIKRIYGMNMIFDRSHMLGHNEIAPISKPVCPGPYFPWSTIIRALN